MLSTKYSFASLDKKQNCPGKLSEFLSKMFIFYTFSEIFVRKRQQNSHRNDNEEIPKFCIFPVYFTIVFGSYFSLWLGKVNKTFWFWIGKSRQRIGLSSVQGTIYCCPVNESLYCAVVYTGCIKRRKKNIHKINYQEYVILLVK